MVNKFCPNCGGENPIKWKVAKEIPYRWVLQCRECSIVWVETALKQKDLRDYL